MKATDQLREEHESVIRMLQVLSAAGKQLSSGISVPVDDLDLMVDFLRNFVDQCHHGKEESLLFPKLVEIGIPNEGGPVGVMLAEHVQGRGYIKGIGDGIALMKQGDPAGRSLVIRNSTAYADLLDNHIHKENNILFRMGEMHLVDSDMEELSHQFAELEMRVLGADRVKQYHLNLEDLAARYL